MKSGKWFGLALYHIHCNIEIDVDKIIHRFAKVSSAREEWNWPKSCLNDSETQERGVQGVKIKKKEKRKHEICFCTSLVRFLIRQQLERKYHTRVLFLCELVLSSLSRGVSSLFTRFLKTFQLAKLSDLLVDASSNPL